MRPSFLQAAVAAAVTSVAVAKERKEREEGEVAASRVQSSPFLFSSTDLFVLPTLRSLSLPLSLPPSSLPRKYYLDITVVFCAFVLPPASFHLVHPAFPQPPPPPLPFTSPRGWSPGRYNSISSYVAGRPSGTLSLYRGLANRISIY